MTPDELLTKLGELAAAKALPRDPRSPVNVPWKVQQQLGLEPVLRRLVADRLIEPLMTPGDNAPSVPSQETFSITRDGWIRIATIDPFLALRLDVYDDK